MTNDTDVETLERAKKKNQFSLKLLKLELISSDEYFKDNQ
jgi:hypothetical protein